MDNSSIVDIQGIGPVLFQRSRRARRISISVKPFKGVRVAVPYGLSFKKAEEFVRTKSDWIQKNLRRMKQYEIESDTISGASIDIDRVKAKRKLTERLKQIAEKHGFTYNRVFIRNQKTRWGSCSHKNNISLNVKLIRMPEELMDYVIMHELVHTRIKDHSNDFWNELDKLVGKGRVLASRLRKYRIEFF